MKRYYLCKILGDGTENNPFRPAVAAHKCNWTAAIPTGEDGKPLFPNCLALVAAVDHADILADKDCDGLPDYPLDAKMSAMHGPTKTALIAQANARGVAINPDAADGYREV